MTLVEKILNEVWALDKKGVPSAFIERIKSLYNVTSVLASGLMGSAFLTAEGKVLKITGDESEALLSHKLLNKNFNHYINIYSVKKHKINGENIFVILKEYVESLSDEEKELMDICHYLDEYLIPSGMWFNRYKTTDLNEKLDYIRVDADFNYNLSYRLEDKNNESVLSFYKEYRSMLKELYKYKVTDLSAANTGRKINGTLAGFDYRLGSEVKGSVNSIK